MVQYTYSCRTRSMSVLQTGICEPGNRKFSSAGTCKKYRRTIDSGTASRRKIMKNADLPSTRSGFHHACMRCSAGLDLHAWSYELASCLKGAAGSKICQSGAAMPDRLAPLAGHKPPCVSNGQHVFSAKPILQQ